MLASDIDGNHHYLMIDRDIPTGMTEEAHKAWVEAGRPSVNGIMDPHLTVGKDEKGWLTLHCNAEGLMALRELVEEAFMAATFSTHPHLTPDCLVMTPRFKRPDGTELVLKLNIEDFTTQQKRLAKIWTHHARANGIVVSNHDNP